jgi:hypothetical protein
MPMAMIDIRLLVLARKSMCDRGVDARNCRGQALFVGIVYGVSDGRAIPTYLEVLGIGGVTLIPPNV